MGFNRDTMISKNFYRKCNKPHIFSGIPLSETLFGEGKNYLVKAMVQGDRL